MVDLSIILCANDHKTGNGTGERRRTITQSITIERSFGILLRRWGILWRPISYSLDKIPKIVCVCAILHNICVDRWVKNNPV